MSDPKYHPGEVVLLDYANGSLGEASALVVATHLALCPGCRNEVAEMEAIGGALLESAPIEPISEHCLTTVMARLEERGVPAPSGPLTGAAGCAVDHRDPTPVPEPLRSCLTAPLRLLAWRSVMRGIDEVDLGIGRGTERTRLIRIRAGAGVPQHSHTGIEFSLVLTGSFHDQRGRFCRGDAVLDDATVDHRPVADRDKDCICLTVTDAPLRLTGVFSRVLRPLVRWPLLR